MRRCRYVQEREQFGQKIAKFQGIRWIIADMATEIEAARQLLLSAARMKEAGENYTAQASMAKLYASEMVNRVTAQALQLHGGYGFTKEYAVERYYRDARVFTIYEGTSEIQRIVISNHILKDKRTLDQHRARAEGVTIDETARFAYIGTANAGSERISSGPDPAGPIVLAGWRELVPPPLIPEP